APARRTLTEGELPAHLAHITGTDWAFWRWVVIRGAGFPAEQALKLSEPDCAAIAERLIKAEEEGTAAQEAVTETLHSRIGTADKENRPVWSKALRQIKKGKLPDLPIPALSVMDEDIAGQLSQLQELTARAIEIGQEFQRAYQTAIERISMTVRSIGGS